MQEVHGDHAGFVPLGNLAEEMFCGVRSVFDGVRSIHFSRYTVRVQWNVFASFLYCFLFLG